MEFFFLIYHYKDPRYIIRKDFVFSFQPFLDKLANGCCTLYTSEKQKLISYFKKINCMVALTFDISIFGLLEIENIFFT